MSDFKTIIGLEIHIQLSTASRLFSAEPAGESRAAQDTAGEAVSGVARPNSASGPWSLGHPGTYPVLNQRAVESAIKLGLSFDCRINPVSTFDRKHYFYPDLPRGFQITQQAVPVCEAGTYTANDRPKSGSIRIRRIHLEEDAGRMIHRADRTLVDYDRAGVPLLELVTEPDFRRPGDAADFLRDLRDIVRTLQIGDGRMEDGSIRCDANISVRTAGKPDGDGNQARVEIKNMNSFRHVEQALTFEADRQIALRRTGSSVREETRRFDAGAGRTVSMRSKETAPDYRFITEPDLPPLRIEQETIKDVAESLPERPDRKRQRFRDVFALSADWARILSTDLAAGRMLDQAVALIESEPAAEDARSSPLIRRCAGILVEEVIGADRPLPDANALLEIATLLEHREIASGAVGRLLGAVADSDDCKPDVTRLAAEQGMLVTLEPEDLDPFILGVIREHPDEWRRYVGGKDGLLGFFVGRVLGTLEESADPAVVSERLAVLRSRDRGAEIDPDGDTGRD